MVSNFNTAYNIAKEELLFTKFKSQITLMKNRLNVNPTYANDMTCAQFIGKIIRQPLGKDKTASDSSPSFMIDDATDISTKECEIVYAHVIDNGRPSNILIGHTEVEHAHVKGMGCVCLISVSI